MSDEECVLDRLITLSDKPTDNVPSLRSTLARIHSKAASHDVNARAKLVEKLCRPSSGYLPLLLSLLESVKDHPSLCSLVGILHECSAPKSAVGEKGPARKSNSSRVVATEQLVQLGGTLAVLKLVLNVVKDTTSNQQQQSTPAWPHQFTHDLLWLLAHLAQRDGRFALKCRTSGALKLLHVLLKNHVSSSKLLYPLLMVMKILARNTNTSKLMVKDGAAQTLEVTLTSLGLAPHPRLRLCIDVMNSLAKNPAFCARLARTQVIHILLRLIERCDHQEGKLQIRICSAILSTLYKMCVFKAGRVVFRSHNGLQILHSFCSLCPDEKNRDAIVGKASDLLAICLENRAPLLADTPQSPAKFPLPIPLTNIYTPEDRSGSSSRDTTPNSEDDKVSEEDCLLDAEETCVEDNVALPQIMLRDVEELKSYSTFFEEFSDSHRSSRDSSLSDSEEEDSLSSASKSTRSSSQSECEAMNPIETLKNLKIFSKIRSGTDPFKVYFSIASKVNSVIPFVKVAYPDMVGAESVNVPEPLYTKDRKVCRSKLMQCIEKGLHPEQGMNKVVYDIDSLVNTRRNSYTGERQLSNWDESRLGKETPDVSHLLFESRFESGNLRRATQVGALEYELILMPDVNSIKHHQWFYFEVSNMKADVPYTFNIINCEKQNSQFNFGMKPLFFSVYNAVHEHIGWARAGSDICYYRNTYINQTAGSKMKLYLTTSFSITFPHARDVCYLAYHYPYPYSRMQMQLWNWAHTTPPGQMIFKVQQLCYSLNDNEVPIVTITSPERVTSPIQNREIVILTGRVHPGESNASWVMEGILQFLLSSDEHAVSLRENFVFKIIPMLNPEGVINGCHRCGLTDEDLNRRWSRPDPTLHPVIFHAKGVIEYCCRVLHRQPFFYCDLHGHSRRKNVFFYGCSQAASWNAADRTVPEDSSEFLLLPHILQQTAPAFALNHCSFRVERGREATARVALWRQLGITRSYTLESSYCGCDQGHYEGFHLGTAHLHEMGRNLCEALGTLYEDGWKLKLMIPTNNPQPYANEQSSRVIGGIAGLGGVRTSEEETLLINPSDDSDYEEEYHAMTACY